MCIVEEYKSTAGLLTTPRFVSLESTYFCYGYYGMGTGWISLVLIVVVLEKSGTPLVVYKNTLVVYSVSCSLDVWGWILSFMWWNKIPNMNDFDFWILLYQISQLMFLNLVFSHDMSWKHDFIICEPSIKNIEPLQHRQWSAMRWFISNNGSCRSSLSTNLSL